MEIQFRKRHLWIECKRVHSKKKICDNILGAHDQFHKKKTRYDQKGIIAVSIEKIMDQHNLIHMVESQERLAAIGRSIIEEFAKEAEPAIAKLKRSRIVALMYYLKYTGNIKGTLEMIPSNMYLVHNLRTETVLNYDDWVTVEALIEYCGSVE